LERRYHTRKAWYRGISGSCVHPAEDLLNPAVLIEVLSPSIEAYDRGRKFEHYQSIESLKEYLMVDSARVHADLYTKQPDGRWLLTSANGLEDWLTLESIDCTLTLKDLYEGITPEPATPPTA
jgi:Uma2 family endonuclease